MSLAAALVFGLLIGAVLGALGGGGAILTVPVLVYVLGQSVQQATTSSLVIVGITAVAGAIGHARAGHHRWGIALSFGITGIAGAYAGTAVNTHIDSRILLIGFAAVLIAAAIGILVRAPPRRAPSTVWQPVMVVVAGLVAGFLTGLFGVGGGFIIVPALTLALGLPMPVAVGTSLLIIALNSATSLMARAGTEQVDWGVIIPFTATAVAGTIAGQKIADRLHGATLNRAFAALLIMVATYTGAHNLLALA